MSIPADMSANWQVADDEALPRVFTGGWVGYSGYDTVRYVYSGVHALLYMFSLMHAQHILIFFFMCQHMIAVK